MKFPLKIKDSTFNSHIALEKYWILGCINNTN